MKNSALENAPVLVDVEPVAKVLRRKPAAVYRMVREGRVGGVVRTGERGVLFDWDAFLAWVKAGGVQPSEPRAHER